MKSIYILVACFLFVGCEKTPEEKAIITQGKFNTPQYVGTLKDGRKILCVTPYNGDRIYYFDNGEGNEVTVNYIVQEGKTSSHEVIVMLDGTSISTNYISNMGR